ncbi:hypothetical protein Avbf_06575 [Armadillidium vulgare]|nr:hypothetical protein Avbf_06575 [Armadillidium vulgare]
MNRRRCRGLCALALNIRTYQIQLTLTSAYDDMRCTLLRLLEKVKNLELKNSLDVIKFLNITSHNADGCGNLLEEGIPEVIPKRDCPCFYFTGFDLEILNNCGAKNKSYNQFVELVVLC